MTWNLFIDDERLPCDVFWMETGVLSKYSEEVWNVARDFNEMKELIETRGSFPSFISFDHDLGDHTLNSYEIVKLLVEDIIDGKYTLPENFDFVVHSMNPIGKRNIEMYLENFLNMWK